MLRAFIMFFVATTLFVGCDGLPAPAQYDHSMLREYFGKNAQQVEATFGKPSSVTQTEVESPPADTSTEEKEEFNKITEGSARTYATADGDLVFHFNLNGEVYAIGYAGQTVSPPKSKSP